MEGRKTRDESRLFTKAVHAGHDTREGHRALAGPIYRSSTFAFPSADRAFAIHEGLEPGFFYGRMSNPTQASLEAALADLEGGESALAMASGMAAISTALLTELSAGDHIVAPRALYASTRSLMLDFLGPMGITTTFVDAGNPTDWAAATQPETKLLYVETPSNPTLQVTDLSAIAGLARSRGIVTVADNTFATPFNQRPLECGIDVVVHSATKYLGGHGDLVAGAIVGPDELITRARWKTLKLLGGVIAPDVAWLVLRGLRTLPLRMERHNENALSVARHLTERKWVKGVHYPGLEVHPGHSIAAEQMDGFGGIVSFEVESTEAAKRLIDRLELCALAISLGDTRTLIQHSASMTHASTPESERRRAGLRDGLLRLSVGLERPADIIADLDQAGASL